MPTTYAQLEQDYYKAEAELTAANERIREMEDAPRKYVQINGKGPTYCLHGTSSISAFEALEAALEFEKSQLRVPNTEQVGHATRNPCNTATDHQDGG